MTVTIKRPDGAEIVLTGPGAEVCVVLETLLGKKKSECKSGSSVKLTDEEDTRLTQLYHEGYRWLARDEDGELYAYKGEPELFGFTGIWLGHCPKKVDVPEKLFSFVDSTDDEPTAIEPIIRAMILEDAHE